MMSNLSNKQYCHQHRSSQRKWTDWKYNLINNTFNYSSNFNYCIDGKTKFVCVDGPEFDAHLVDWDNMMMRMKSFKDREQEDFHKCKMQEAADKLAK